MPHPEKLCHKGSQLLSIPETQPVFPEKAPGSERSKKFLRQQSLTQMDLDAKLHACVGFGFLQLGLEFCFHFKTACTHLRTLGRGQAWSQKLEAPTLSFPLCTFQSWGRRTSLCILCCTELLFIYLMPWEWQKGIWLSGLCLLLDFPQSES